MADILGTVGADILTGSNIENNIVIALNGDDTINGGSLDDLILGNQGQDTINASAGNDVVFAGQGADNVTGDLGNDSIFGDFGNDSLNGGAGFDVVRGGQGNDSVMGDNGNDTLYGGAGQDTLTGGAGADVFVLQTYTALAGNEQDVVTDFVKGTDKIGIANGVNFSQLILDTTSVSGSTIVHADFGPAHYSLEILGATHLDASDFVHVVV